MNKGDRLRSYEIVMLRNYLRSLRAPTLGNLLNLSPLV
jgi:hypothetical protein